MGRAPETIEDVAKQIADAIRGEFDTNDSVTSLLGSIVYRLSDVRDHLARIADALEKP